jgi:hypothetical protein
MPLLLNLRETVAINKFTSAIPSMIIQMLENMYEMVYKSKIEYGIEVLSLTAWK